MKFAKLFNLEDGSQVLLTREDNEENEEKSNIVIRTDFDDVSMKATLTLGSEEKAMKALDSFDEKGAIAFKEDLSVYSSEDK